MISVVPSPRGALPAPASSAVASQASISTRKAASPPQASSRNAARSSGVFRFKACRRMSCFRLPDNGSGACMTALGHSVHKIN